MDGLSAASSVLATLGCAIQSAKFIADAVSNVKAAPNRVAQFHSDANHLRQSLIQLIGLVQKAQCGGAIHQYDLEAIKKVVNDCATDLAVLCNDVKGVQSTHRIISAMKFFIKEKNLERAETSVRYHTAKINFHVTALGT
jgi:hypothetical protein